MNMKSHVYESRSAKAIYQIHRTSKIRYWFWIILAAVVICMFLPWTQNIKSKGNITTLTQEQRPQKINSPIPGRIARWYVKEGDFVKKGDTIITLDEIKEDYLDPNLVGRTQDQVDAKKGSIDFYRDKIKTTESQISNLEQLRDLKTAQLRNKLSQLNNKLAGEQAEFTAAENEAKLLKNQYERQLKMYEQGLVSQTQLQQRNIQYQNALSKQAISENKLAQTRQEIINVGIEQTSVQQEYAEKINKAEGEKFQYLSQISTTQADVSKLENQVTNYTIRNRMYFITAPQDGQIVQANKSGIGEILKDGESIAQIVPNRMNFAVEIFVNPMDLPLVNLGQKVRFVFDGFPAIIFSGWPDNSYGTFTGTIVALENSIGPNGKYRVLVAEDKQKKRWPDQLKLGAGAQAILLLNDVPIWYELWRNINGFPPDFYTSDKAKNEKEVK